MKTEKKQNHRKVCFELTKTELEGHSTLSDLSSKAGYPSLNSFLNDHHLWSEPVESVEKILRSELSQKND